MRTKVLMILLGGLVLIAVCFRFVSFVTAPRLMAGQNPSIREYDVTIKHGSEVVVVKMLPDKSTNTLRFHVPMSRSISATDNLVDFTSGYVAMNVLNHDLVLILRWKDSMEQYMHSLKNYLVENSNWPVKRPDVEMRAAAKEIPQDRIVSVMGQHIGEFCLENPSHMLLLHKDITSKDTTITKPSDKVVELNLKLDVLGQLIKVTGKVEETSIK